ncbi:hypothetical protein BGZ47_008938, partial [Haplosporangium gracile]
AGVPIRNSPPTTNGVPIRNSPDREAGVPIRNPEKPPKEVKDAKPKRAFQDAE